MKIKRNILFPAIMLGALMAFGQIKAIGLRLNAYQENLATPTVETPSHTLDFAMFTHADQEKLWDDADVSELDISYTENVQPITATTIVGESHFDALGALAQSGQEAIDACLVDEALGGLPNNTVSHDQLLPAIEVAEKVIDMSTDMHIALLRADQESLLGTLAWKANDLYDQARNCVSHNAESLKNSVTQWSKLPDKVASFDADDGSYTDGDYYNVASEDADAGLFENEPVQEASMDADDGLFSGHEVSVLDTVKMAFIGACAAGKQAYNTTTVQTGHAIEKGLQYIAPAVAKAQELANAYPQTANVLTCAAAVAACYGATKAVVSIHNKIVAIAADKQETPGYSNEVAMRIMRGDFLNKDK